MMYLTGAYNADTILEVGSGTGMLTSIFINSLMKEGALHVVTDFSEKMVESVREHVAASRLADSHSTEWPVERTGQRQVVSLQADVMDLPFEEGTFEAYIGHLVWHLVPDYGKLLKKHSE